VFVTHDSYSEAGYGLQWQQALLNQYGVNHWCLTVDADEWFIYPGYEDKPLTDLVAYLVRSDAQGMFAFLLDMYGRATLTEGEIATQRSLLDSCPYFDGEYVWRQRPRIPVVQGPRFPEYNITGGPRWRVLFPLAHRHYHLMWWVWHLSSYLKVPLPASLKSVPTLTKIPFVRWLPGTRYQHPHATTPIRLSRVTGVLLHFKFLADFHDRVATEVVRKEHWQAASEYVRYQAKLKKGNPWSAFYYSGSVAYESSDQLVRLGLMREDRKWAQLRGATHASPTIVTR
jgi:hypothetical protein